MGAWVKVRGDGGYVNLANAVTVEPVEVSTGVWRPRITTLVSSAYGQPHVESDTFASATDCSEFIRQLLHGFNPSGS